MLHGAARLAAGQLLDQRANIESKPHGSCFELLRDFTHALNNCIPRTTRQSPISNLQSPISNQLPNYSITRLPYSPCPTPPFAPVIFPLPSVRTRPAWASTS